MMNDAVLMYSPTVVVKGLTILTVNSVIQTLRGP